MKWRTAIDSAVAPFGLTHAKYVVLASLREVTARGAEPSQRELADFAGLDRSTSRSSRAAWSGDGLIERRADAHDTRIARLALTRAGWA